MVLFDSTAAQDKYTSRGLRKLALLGKNTFFQELGYPARYIQTLHRSSKGKVLSPFSRYGVPISAKKDKRDIGKR
jgi:hypothetical protein